MSSRQRKRPGGAVGSRPARKRSRLLPSSAGGTSQTEPRDLEESGAPAFEPEVIDLTGDDIIDLTGESSEAEVITISDNESPVDREQSQQQPHLSRASENPVEPLARNDEEEPIEDDGDWLRFTFEHPFWSDADSEAREQNQQHSQLSRAAENSAGPVATRDKEEPRDNNGAWAAGPACPPMREGDSSQVQDREQSQQHPLGSREAESSAELQGSDNEEEPRDNNDSINSDEWADRFESPPTWQDDITDDWEGSQQYSLHSTSTEDSVELVPFNLLLEPRDIEFEGLRSLVSPPHWEDDNAEAREQNQQHSQLSRAAENSAGPVATRDKEEPRDNNGAWAAGPACPPMREGDSSQVQDREQSQQHPLGSREAESSAELQGSDNEEEPRDNNDSINSDEWADRFESPPTWQDDITDDWEGSQQYSLHSTSTEDSVELVPFNLLLEPRDIEFEGLRSLVSPPHWEDDNAEAREQNQQHSQLSRAAENSAGPVATRDKEEPRDNNGAWAAGPACPPMREGDSSQVQDREQSQQHPLGSREAESSAELQGSDNEEEPRDNNDSINSDEWADRFESPPTWQDDITDDWEGSQQYSLHSTSTEDSVELVPFNLLLEPRDIEFEGLRSLVSPPHWEDDNAEVRTLILL
ncbi:uncharacterized protein LOC113460741 isoform X2 [Zonotrichia albicollis]|uniref:uncharacterized protein LOC113460741 isoform X2 n=1 Tax=Zonotrichia albicollis TaxID=44394 RepID=UPI003D80FA8F